MYPLLNQALRHEEETQTANRNCHIQGAYNVIPRATTPAQKTTEGVTCAHFSVRVTRKPSHRDDLRIRVLLHVESAIRHKQPGTDGDHASTVEPSPITLALCR